jgi:nitric oxide reductase subunit B
VEAPEGRRAFLISKTWIQVVLLVVLCGFFVLGPLAGEPAEHMALGAFFSAAEVIPLTFLTVEAWSFLQLGAAQESRSLTPFPHRWAVMFLVAVGFWNFLGAGIFGFLINLPIVSYYEIGTALTANHGHAAVMGVYGMLALGLAMFCLRYLIPAEKWPERWAKICSTSRWTRGTSTRGS